MQEKKHRELLILSGLGFMPFRGWQGRFPRSLQTVIERGAKGISAVDSLGLYLIFGRFF